MIQLWLYPSHLLCGPKGHTVCPRRDCERDAMRKIALLNQKGGVGKTTTAVNLGACIAERGRTVLLVDIDPQANLTTHLGLDVKRGQPSVYTLIRGEHSREEVLRDTAMDSLKVIPADIDLAGLEVELSTQSWGRELHLARALRGLEEQFDYVFVDCPPSLGLLTLNAMCAVEEIFIPLQTEFFALHGLGKLLSTVRLVQQGLNPTLEATGIVACMFDARTSLAGEVLEDIRGHFGGMVFQTLVRKNVRLAEAPSFGLPVILYDEECNGAEDYRALAGEVLAMAGEERQDQPAAQEIPPHLSLAKAG